jgi:hypothetical protein
VLLDFANDSAMASIGLWMGPQIGSTLPTDPSTDPQDPDGLALHLSGTADEQGMDTFWHVGTALDRLFRTVRFRAKTEHPDHPSLIVALAGSSSTNYYQDLAGGRPWHAAEVLLTNEWQDYEIALAELKPLGPGMPTPTFDVPWSALHFITPPSTRYDVWISYLEFR